MAKNATPAADSPTSGPTPEENLASIIGDPDLVQSVSEDPFLKFLVNQWRFIITTILTALAVLYAVNTFRETRERDMESAGDALFRVQREFAALESNAAQTAHLRGQLAANDAGKDKDKIKPQIESLEKEKTETEHRLKDALTALSDTRAPYNHIADLYRAILAHESGDAKAFENTLDPHAWEKITATGSNERFFAELDALGHARALLDSKTGLEEGRKELRKLAAEGSFVNVTAGLAYSATAESKEQRADAYELLMQIQSAHPEQSSLLEQELERLKE